MQNSRNLAELVAAARGWEEGISEIAVPRPQDMTVGVEGLLVGGQRIPLTQEDRSRLFKKVGAPVGYLKRFGTRLQIAALSEHFDRRDFGRAPKVVLRNREFHTITRGDLIDLRSNEVLAAVAEALGKEGESLSVSRIERNDERLEVELLSPSKAIEVRPGDIVNSGISITHAPYGNEATVIQSYILRLLCSNGMTRRECASRDGIVRTRKLSVHYPNGREIQLNQIRQLASRHWSNLQLQLEAFRATTQRPANVEELLRGWLLRARISRDEMMPRLLAAWHSEGRENTHYGAVNALTRVATHDLEVSARQRRVLSGLAGLLAFSQVHLCDRCYSVLTTAHQGAELQQTG